MVGMKFNNIDICVSSCVRMRALGIARFSENRTGNIRIT